MQFYLNDKVSATGILLDKLQLELKKGQKILLLLSGGSNITVGVDLLNALPSELTSKLTISLFDERYGPVGHKDSNWQQLLDAGLGTKEARVILPLKTNVSVEEAAIAFENDITQAFVNSDISIGLLGMGEDSHIAGILPNSAAALETEGYVKAYESVPHTRLTLTFAAIRKISYIYVFAYGSTKKAALEHLHTTDEDFSKFPVQYLKKCAQVYMYNDQIGEKV